MTKNSDCCMATSVPEVWLSSNTVFKTMMIMKQYFLMPILILYFFICIHICIYLVEAQFSNLKMLIAEKFNSGKTGLLNQTFSASWRLVWQLSSHWMNRMRICKALLYIKKVDKNFACRTYSGMAVVFLCGVEKIYWIKVNALTKIRTNT